MKKGQGATEYLIILAVVIVIALIVVAVMGGIPGIGGGAGVRASAAYWAATDVAITSYAVSFGTAATNSVDMTIKNNMRNQITITSLSLDGEVICGTTPITLVAGGTSSCDKTPLLADLCDAAGNAYSLDVSITYTDDATDASYTFTGAGTKLEGTCAT